MIDFISGNIELIEEDFVVLECENIGYVIYIINSKNYKINQRIKFYVYEHINEYIKKIYGFDSREKQKTFQTFISVNSIGPKTALEITKKDGCELMCALREQNVNYFKAIHTVGPKTAKKIIETIKNIEPSKEKNKKYKINENFLSLKNELTEILLAMGYNEENIVLFIQKNKLQLNMKENIDLFIKIDKIKK